MLRRFHRFHEQVIGLFREDQGDAHSHPRWRNFIRFWARVVENFIRNRCPLWASGLTYSSLLAFVPLLAVVIGISTSLLKSEERGIRGWIDDLLENLVPQLMRSDAFADVKDSVVDTVVRGIEQVNSGAIGTTGVIALLVMILFMLARVEESLNEIWGVSQGRSWFKRLVNYWAAITLGPIIIIAAIGYSTSLQLGRDRTDKPEFVPEDFRDLPALVDELQNPDDPVSKFVSQQLRDVTKTNLVKLALTGPSPDKTTLTNLLTDLNNLVRAHVIYDTNRFAGIHLRPETRRLLSRGQNLTNPERIRLNRFLLEDAFPREFVRIKETWIEGLPVIGRLLVPLIPIPILCGVCTIFYALMPNTRVRWGAAAVGGLVAGILWFLNNTLGVLVITQATRDKAIYGSLAAVPVFMVGMYLFWLLLLFGAQVAYTFQNRKSYLAEKVVNQIHQEGRELVALRIMLEASRAFVTQSPPPSVNVLVERLAVPSQLICQVTATLVKSQLLVQVNHGDCGYQPARPLEMICVWDVIDAMRRDHGNRIPRTFDAASAIAELEISRVTQAAHKAGSRTMAELVWAKPE